MRKFVTRLLVFLLPYFFIYTVIAVINYKVDQACMFSRAWMLDTASDDLLSGKIIVAPANMNRRSLQNKIIKKMEKIPSTIVIGDSTIITLRASYLGLDQGSFFNHSVPGGVIKDYIAIIGCYKKKGALPKTIIMSVDSHLFDKRFGVSRKWKSIASEYYYLLSFIKGGMSKPKIFYNLIKAKSIKVERLLSYRYAISNYNYFNKILRKGTDYRVVKNTSVDDWLVTPDGSMFYPYRIRFQDDALTQEKIPRNMNKRIRRYGQITFQETFRSFIDYLLDNGVQIILFIPPYHPTAYQEIKRKKEPHFVIKVEEMVRSLAKSRKILVIGSYDPSSFDLTSQDFFNAIHLHDYAVEKIFKGYQQVVHRTM